MTSSLCKIQILRDDAFASLFTVLSTTTATTWRGSWAVLPWDRRFPKVNLHGYITKNKREGHDIYRGKYRISHKVSCKFVFVFFFCVEDNLATINAVNHLFFAGIQMIHQNCTMDSCSIGTEPFSTFIPNNYQ